MDLMGTLIVALFNRTFVGKLIPFGNQALILWVWGQNEHPLLQTKRLKRYEMLILWTAHRSLGEFNHWSWWSFKTFRKIKAWFINFKKPPQIPPKSILSIHGSIHMKLLLTALLIRASYDWWHHGTFLCHQSLQVLDIFKLQSLPIEHREKPD